MSRRDASFRYPRVGMGPRRSPVGMRRKVARNRSLRARSRSCRGAGTPWSTRSGPTRSGCRSTRSSRRARRSSASSRRPIFFFGNFPAHADGRTPRAHVDVKAPKDASQIESPRIQSNPRRSPSACAEKLPKSRRAATTTCPRTCRWPSTTRPSGRSRRSTTPTRRCSSGSTRIYFWQLLGRTPTANAEGRIESAGSIGEVSARRVFRCLRIDTGPRRSPVGMRRNVAKKK